MKYDKRMLGYDLVRLLDANTSAKDIGEWAQSLRLDHDIDDVYDIVYDLMGMSEGIEFAYSREELLELARQCLFE